MTGVNELSGAGRVSVHVLSPSLRRLALVVNHRLVGLLFVILARFARAEMLPTNVSKVLMCGIDAKSDLASIVRTMSLYFE